MHTRTFAQGIVMLPLIAWLYAGWNRELQSVVEHRQSARPGEEEWVSKQLSNLSLEEKIAQSFMVACRSNEGEAHLLEVQHQVENDKIGGIIFFQGERENLVNAIARMQQKAKVPLLIGMDAEWGVAMRIFGEERFPYAQTIGAADDLQLTERIGRAMAIECDQLGIHLNFAPVADVNSNPDNPVIGFRSFGENPVKVAEHVNAFVRGMESEHILTCVKHFPGHGDTDKDSHLELPVVSHDAQQFRSVDFLPFRSGIAGGAGAVMVAHLSVPKLDSSGVPSSLSEKVIQGYLRKELGFKGLVVSDALNMKAIADRYGKSEAVLKAYQAGCDILLYPESVSEAIALIAKKVKAGNISEKTVNERCSNVLRAKYRYIVSKPMVKRIDPAPERYLAIAGVCEKAITVLKNDGNVLPLDRLDRKIARISVGTNSSAFYESADRYSYMDNYSYFTAEEAARRLKSIDLGSYDVILLDFHAGTQRASNNYGFGDWKSVVSMMPEKAEVAAVFFGNPLFLKAEKNFPAEVDAAVMAWENLPMMQDRAAQFVFGALDADGKLSLTLNESFPAETGMTVKGNGRLKYTIPEELGISSAKLSEIDAIVDESIKMKAFPGCQVAIAIEGKMIYNKAFGKPTYESADSVTKEMLYDIASVTKIASSTYALMKLQGENKFTVNNTLSQLVPEITNGTAYNNMLAIDMLTHQAGLTPWIAFYKATVKDGQPNPAIYSHEQKEGFSIQVADSLWIRDDYPKTMYSTILQTPLSGRKVYEYSDLGYYFFKKYIEKTTGMSQDQYVQYAIYKPLGLRRITYLPLKKFPLSQIAPTENDQEFRKQLIHGYVHDPGAAMLGGVGGHAGIFATATDLSALMQVLLNNGMVGDYQVIHPDIVKQYTACQFCPKNRRGIGFDRPTNSGGGPCSKLASAQSFGHSGFTGTLAWMDPVHKVNYVFLSNRVYPDATNWKIRDMNIRTRIQDIIYQSITQSDLK